MGAVAADRVATFGVPDVVIANAGLPGLLDADTAARQLVDAIGRGRTKVTVPRRTGLISHGLTLLPDALEDRILLAQPRKPRAGEPGATEVPGL